MIKEFFSKRKFDLNSDRLGPDCPFTHWRLFFKSRMKKLCKERFESFGNSSEFRAGAYAISCSKISIGERVVIRPGTMLFADPSDGKNGKITVEDDVLIGSGVHVYVSNHKFDNTYLPIIKQGHYEPENVIIKTGSWIGANVIVLPGVIIGKNSVIGAGSVVTKTIPDNVVAAGNPAKVIKKIK